MKDMLGWYQFEKDSKLVVLDHAVDNFPSFISDADYIIVVNSVSCSEKYFQSKEMLAGFFRSIKENAKKNSKLIFATDNRMGLKYIAGCRERMHGLFFEGIEGYPHMTNAVTFSKPEIEFALQKSGLANYYFYFPYPDLEEIDAVYSEERLPKVGELTSDRGNKFSDRMKLFNETLAFDKIIEDKMFPYFSNAFVIEINLE